MPSLFNIPSQKNTRDGDLALAKKSNTKAKAQTTIRGGNSILEKIQLIQRNVLNALGKYKDDYIIIRDVNTLRDYIDKCVDNGIVAIDTETTGLDPMQDKCVGICIYTPNTKGAYIPINHTSYITMARIANQLTEKDVKVELDRLVSTKVIMFNAKFDIRVLRNQIGTYLKCYWDGYLGARLLNENEPTNALKLLHQKYVLKGKEDAFKFDDLFNGITFDKVPIDVAYIYGAHDAVITYELYEFQKKYLSLDQDREDLRNVAWVFHNIEMPCVEVVCDMEDFGIELDMNVANRLSSEYNAKLIERENAFYDALEEYQPLIDAYMARNPNHKLDIPINMGSPTQLAILFYDILQIEPPDPKKPRATGVGELSKIDNPLAKAILNYREVSKLINTYIDKLPTCVNPKDGRIHCSFNQYGADTGRMSSNNPNLNLWAYM